MRDVTVVGESPVRRASFERETPGFLHTSWNNSPGATEHVRWNALVSSLFRRVVSPSVQRQPKIRSLQNRGYDCPPQPFVPCEVFVGGKCRLKGANSRTHTTQLRLLSRFHTVQEVLCLPGVQIVTGEVLDSPRDPTPAACSPHCRCPTRWNRRTDAPGGRNCAQPTSGDPSPGVHASRARSRRCGRGARILVDDGHHKVGA